MLEVRFDRLLAFSSHLFMVNARGQVDEVFVGFLK
jgi:hypothetical protein